MAGESGSTGAVERRQEINLLMPPKFNGTDGSDIRKGLRMFQEFADDCDWDDTKGARKLKLLLCGEAQLFVWDLSEEKQKSLKLLKEELTKQYGGSADSFQAMAAFEARKRQPGETLRELCFALRQLHQKASPDDARQRCAIPAPAAPDPTDQGATAEE